MVPKDIVLEDIRRLVRVGATHITFGDPDFLNGPRHSLAIVRTMHAEFPELTFDFTAKVEHILERRTFLPELGALGCLFVVSAVESLSDTVLANLEKGHTRADFYEALRIVKAAGIVCRPTWVAFTPWTTLNDYLDVLDVVEIEGLVDHVDPVQYTIRLLIPPGSMLLDRPAIRPFLGPLDQAAFSYRWSHPTHSGREAGDNMRQSWQLGFSASPERNDGSYQNHTPARHRHQIRAAPRRRDLDSRDISEKIACGNCRKHEEERARHTETRTGFTRWRVAFRLVLFAHLGLSARWPLFLCEGKRSRAYTQPKCEERSFWLWGIRKREPVVCRNSAEDNPRAERKSQPMLSGVEGRRTPFWHGPRSNDSASAPY